MQEKNAQKVNFFGTEGRANFGTARAARRVPNLRLPPGRKLGSTVANRIVNYRELKSNLGLTINLFQLGRLSLAYTPRRIQCVPGPIVPRTF